MLILPIKKKWFDMILAGEKLEEYRAITPYYKSRFKNLFSMHPYSIFPTGHDKQKVMLRNGYSRNSPSCIVTATLDVKTGRPEWGAEPGVDYFVLKILEVEAA